jgi:alkylglycerol monooxygenase
MSQVIVFAAPVFIALILMELAYGIKRGRNTYRLNDAVSSIGLGMFSQASGLFTRALRVGIYAWVYQYLAVVDPTAGAAFWFHPAGWVLAVFFYDLCYYWHHRISHTCALFWAAHVVHHQSQDYNLSTALRQTASGAFVGWFFYIPMALAGVPPAVFGIVALVDLLYQFWVHTEHVGRLGWFDRWFCSPSNHRVHHATNDAYLDKNFGGIWVFWDRLFGTFHAEDPANACVYGTRKPLNSWDPLWANTEVYAHLLQSSWQTRRFSDKLRVWFKPPGWMPADLAALAPSHQPGGQRFNPPLGRAGQVFALASFVVMFCAVLALLWWGPNLGLARALLAYGLVCSSLWTIGAVMQGRMAIFKGCVMVAISAAGLVFVFVR